jgi:hypothetical protein
VIVLDEEAAIVIMADIPTNEFEQFKFFAKMHYVCVLALFVGR